MKNIFLILLCLICFQSISQVLPKRPVHVRVYSETGELLNKNSKNYRTDFWEASSYSKNLKATKLSDGLVNDDYGFSAYFDYGDFFTIEMKRNNDKMTIHAQENIDSIPFMVGEFLLTSPLCYLFKIKPEKGVTISNFSWDNLGNKDFQHPTFSILELDNKELESVECLAATEKIEKKHGGKNWARNICNGVYQDYSISLDEKTQEIIDSLENTDPNKLRTKIYPLNKNGFIKHEFYLDSTYYHVISYGNDCKNWKKIMTLNDEWYVNLIFFPDQDKIGIDISNSGVVLISDYSLKNWKYYIWDLSEETKIGKTDGFVFRNENWYDSYPAKFYFSE